MAIDWIEQRGKYGSLYFIARVRGWVDYPDKYPDKQKCLYYFCINFDSETRAGDTWSWSFGRWLTDDWDKAHNWNDYEEIDSGACVTLDMAKLACEVIMLQHINDWRIYQWQIRNRNNEVI